LSSPPIQRNPAAERFAAGATWEELREGRVFRTIARTVTETDLVNFVTAMGLFEPLFTEARDATFGADRRPIPGALTFSMADGLVLQTQVIQGTGMALMGLTLRMVAPVFVGDTIDVESEVIESRPSSREGRGVVVTRNRVFNQDDALVLEYEPARLVAGRGAS
jgi:acyl dehydratase